MPITTLIKDPSPGITPGDGSIIRTDMYNDIVDLINGVSAENYNLVQKVLKKTTTYTMLITDFMILGDATSAAFTITLPDASATGFSQKIIAVKKVDSSANAVTLQTVSSQTIDGGGTSLDLIQLNETVILQSDGTNWQILANKLLPFQSTQLKLANPAGSFYYTIVTSAIVANRNLTVPLLTADSTLSVLELSQTFTATTTQINNLKLGGQLNVNGQTLLNTGTITLPTTTTTLAGLSIAQTWLAAQTFPASGIILAGAGAGLGTLTYANSASSVTITFPATATTLAGLAVVQTFTAATSFQNSTLKFVNPAATFSYTIVSAAIGANYNLTLPLLTGADTLAALGVVQTWTVAQTLNSLVLGGQMNLAGNTILNTGTLTMPTATTTIAGLNVAQTWLQAQTYTTGLLKVADIADANGNKSIAITATASAVDYFTVVNAATANPATLQLNASGSDSNINVQIQPKGTGVVFGNRETWDYAVTDETSAPSTGIKITDGIPYNFTLTDCQVYLTTPGSGGTLLELDVLYESGQNTNSFSTIFTTTPTVDAGEYTSVTAAAPPVLSVTALAKGRRLQYKIKTLDTGVAARGIKIMLIGYATAV